MKVQHCPSLSLGFNSHPCRTQVLLLDQRRSMLPTSFTADVNVGRFPPIRKPPGISVLIHMSSEKLANAGIQIVGK